ncbi:hypothetical protein ACI2OX_03350 [Bacillus sp. N9]
MIKVDVSYENGGTKVQRIQELDETVAVLPDISLMLDPKDMVVNTAKIKEEMPVNVMVKNYFDGKRVAKVSLDLPEGWGVSRQK